MTSAALVVFLALSAGAAPAPQGAPPACKAQKVVKKARLTYPGGKFATVDVVDTPRTREIGLMCRTKLRPDYGMLFVFPAETELGFWMKNTLVSLDILWIGADKKITTIAPRLKASRLDTPESAVARAGGRGQYVLELPAGAARRRGLKVGDELRFDVAIPAS